MSTSRQDDQLPDELTAALKREADDVAPDVAVALQAARRQAALAADRPRRFAWRPLLGVTATAVVAALALAIGLNLRAPESVPPLPMGSELEFVVAQDLEVLEELEFLAWLEEADLGAG